MGRKEFRDLAEPAEARAIIGELDLHAPNEEVPLQDARGRVLAERIDAGLDVPGFDRASVDGYAVRAEDTFGADEANPATLDVVGDIHTGVDPAVTVEPGTCAEISTGAVIPPGADAVVMVERTDTPSEVESAAETVFVRTAVAPGDGVMAAGADVAAGERVMGPGTVITPREIGVLSALGVESVPVHGVPTVGIISTGDELVRPGDSLDSAAGEIYDVNSYTTAAAVEAAGGQARLYPHTGDDADAMESVLREAAAECELVLSSGSTSASAVDVIYRVVEETGDLLLHGVAVKPGKPMLVGRIAESAYIGLPGYPVSALTIFRTFVAPALREAAGVPAPETATVSGTMAVEERYREGRLRYLPVGLVDDGDGTTLVYPVDKGSGATTSLVDADGVVAIPPDIAYLAAGEHVDVQLFSPDVRPPQLVGAGEDDPVVSQLLDHVPRARYLAGGSPQGRRRLRDGVVDIAVITGDPSGAADAVDLGGWQREWGLIVPDGNPADITGLGSLIESDVRFINRTPDSGLRATLDAALDAFADQHEDHADANQVQAAIDGYTYGLRAHESPARKVREGKGDVALGLRVTAAALDMEFIECGTETVTVLARRDRVEKLGVEHLKDALTTHEDILTRTPGVQPQ